MGQTSQQPNDVQDSGATGCSPVPCRLSRPLDVRVLGWCADEKVWKCGYFIVSNNVTFFKHEGQGPIYGEHEVSHWTAFPSAPE